jgi:hypothetical protein
MTALMPDTGFEGTIVEGIGFLNGQGIQITAQQDPFTSFFPFEDSGDSISSQAGYQAVWMTLLEECLNGSSGLRFFVGELWIPVQVVA